MAKGDGVQGANVRRIYVASSWRCTMQPVVVESLRTAGHEVYDFRNPKEGDEGLDWSEVMPSYRRVGPGSPEPPADAREYVEALSHPISEAGFANDFDAMRWADTFVLVLPCGRSAHLEVGWAIGQGKRTAIVLDGPSVVPELMYKLADIVVRDLAGLHAWLKYGCDDPEACFTKGLHRDVLVLRQRRVTSRPEGVSDTEQQADIIRDTGA